MKYERKLINILLSLRPKNVLPEKIYWFIRPSGSCIPSFYGLPKIHKPNIPLRPIVSAMGSVTYNLAKHLVSILSPLYGDTDHHVKDSVDFTRSLLDLRLTRNEIMVSFDVESLFTSVPIKEAMKIIEKRLKEDANLQDRTPISVVDIMKLLEFCLTTTYFRFRNIFYKQIEGLAMGSPISPVVANIYMEEFENQALQSSHHSPRVWKRYIDDIFAVIRVRHLNPFLKHLNSLRPGIIKFTHEVEEKSTLPFLEVLITRTDEGNLFFGVYRKPTHTDQLLNFTSHHPMSAKRSVVTTLTRRSQLIPSTRVTKEEEAIHLRKASRSYLCSRHNEVT